MNLEIIPQKLTILMGKGDNMKKNILLLAGLTTAIAGNAFAVPIPYDITAPGYIASCVSTPAAWCANLEIRQHVSSSYDPDTQIWVIPPAGEKGPGTALQFSNNQLHAILCYQYGGNGQSFVPEPISYCQTPGNNYANTMIIATYSPSSHLIQMSDILSMNYTDSSHSHVVAHAILANTIFGPKQ